MASSPAKKNAAYIFYVGLTSQATPLTLQANPTLATGDVKVSTDGGAFANIGTLPAVTPAAGKSVKVTMASGEMNGDDIVVLFSDAAGAEWADQLIHIQTSARQIDDLAFPATSGRSMVVDANGLVDANTVKVGPTGSGTAQTAGDIPARLPAALTANGNMKSSLMEILTTALTETAGLLAGAFKKFFNVASPTGTANSLPDAVPGAAAGLLIDDVWTDARAAKLDNLDAAVTSRLAISGYTAPDNTSIAAILGQTGTTGVILTAAERTAVATSVWGTVITGSTTAIQAMRGFIAAMLGKASGLDINAPKYRNIADTKDVISATTDANGNRTAVTLDLT